MSDFEQRVSRALADGAEDAPGAGCLAAAARRRQARRVRRRAVVGAVVAVVALGVGGVVTAAVVGDGPDGSADVAQSVDDPGWRTVEVELEPTGVLDEPVTIVLDVPSGWHELPEGDDCQLTAAAYGLGDEPCSQSEAVNLVPDTGAIDFAFGPGLRSADDSDGEIASRWTGYVSVGDVYVTVGADDEQTALRVLGSARFAGQAVPDLSGDWTRASADGVAYTVPAALAAGVEVVPHQGDTEYGYGQWDDGRWRAVLTVGDRDVVALMPTRALAEVMAGSARPAPDDAAGAWTTVRFEGLALDLPPGWTEYVDGDCGYSSTSRVPTRSFSAEPCSAGSGSVSVFGKQGTRPAEPLGSYGNRGGIVWSGDGEVIVSDVAPDVARRIMASVRPAGDAAPDVVTWTTTDLGDGVTAEVPADDRVSVTLSDGVPECTTPGIGPAEGEDGAWRVGLCRNRIVTVRAPTEALALVVAARVRGW
ncbi:hypothetical protein GCM10023340_16810 [Nocardioides marinquilinus]|uniref:LigA protein n=1 Tax=Nocardioides marinquilinus TaxID=1210400 RepID=A0ABP9PMS9_9ACTN